MSLPLRGEIQEAQLQNKRQGAEEILGLFNIISSETRGTRDRGQEISSP
jgi:hypothetical protein